MIIKKVYIAVSLLAIFSCKSSISDVKIAEKTTDKYYSMLVNSEVDSIKYLFSDDFYSRHDTVKLLQFLRTVPDSLGTISTYQLLESKLCYEITDKGKQNAISVVYKIVYQPDNYVAKEKFVFFVNDKFSGKIDQFNTHAWQDKDQ